MEVSLEKILVHANERLSALTAGAPRPEQVHLFKRFLKIETERLRMRHRFGLDGVEIARSRSYLIDLVVCRASDLAAAELGLPSLELGACGAVALGGYGRRELAPFSDVDIMFLHAGKGSAAAKQFAERVLYLLWDIGLTVGHSFRSVSECVAMARRDLHSRTSMAEARLITGNPHLFRRLNKELEKSVYSSRRETENFIESMKLELKARYAKFGKAVCVQEPNVKESAGGLRDLHAVLWVGRARFGCQGLDDLRAEDYISGAEYAAARRAHTFITRIRNEAHFTTGRRTDLLSMDLQPALAAGLGYKDKSGLLFSEVFMRDYYQRAHELHQLCERFLARAMAPPGARTPSSGPAVAEIEERRGKFYLTMKRGAHRTGPAAPEFEIRNGELLLSGDGADLSSNPALLVEAFRVAQVEGASLSDQLKQAVRESLPSLGRSFRKLESASRAFVEILSNKGRVASALRAMHETGFLGRFLPEFGRITFLVQHDYYHKYTIDEHTIKAIEALDRLAVAGDAKLARLGSVFGEVEAPAAVYLAVLLHDIGKGHGRGHVSRGVRIAERICARLGLAPEISAKVVFLVRHHLLMSHLSQRRDLAEDSLIEEFAATVGSLDYLDGLLLVTYADTAGVGPGVWNDWKGALLWELYTRARALIAGGTPVAGALGPLDQTAEIRQQVVQALAGESPASDIERHFAMMPERYLRSTPPDDIVSHFQLASRSEAGAMAADWRLLPDKHCTQLTVCTRDSAGLFARIAGTLTAHGVNILSADLYTREDGLVLDTFCICEVSSHQPIRPELWPRIERNLVGAIEGRYDVAAAVAGSVRPKRRKRPAGGQASVRFHQDVSSTNTVIEVRAEDEPGVAYKIARQLASLDLSINFARITTEKNLALDVFYVTDVTGSKLSPEDMPLVERTVLEGLGAPGPLMKEAV